MALLRFQHHTLIELLRGESSFPSVVRDGLVSVLSEIDEKEAVIALSHPEHSKANFDNLVFERLRNRLAPDFSIERKAHVSTDTRHENDFAIVGSDSVISVEIEKGERARLDLDIRKMEAFARQSPKSAFGVFIVPLNNKLDRSISGSTRQSSFDYVCRTLRLSVHSLAEKAVPMAGTQERIGEALDVLRHGLEPFIDREMRKAHGKDWATAVRKSERKPQSRTTWDVYALLNVLLSYWNAVFKEVLSQTDRSLTYELLEVRNRWAHQEAFSVDDAYRALDSAQRLLVSIKSTEQASKLAQKKNESLRLISKDESHRHLVDVLVIGYRDPTVHGDQPIRTVPIATSRAEISGLVNGTEALSFEELARLVGGGRGEYARASSTLRSLRQTVFRRVPTLTEKVNPKGGYIGYRSDNSDRAYVYVQPNLLVVDVRQPRTIEALLSAAGIEILHRNNYQGRAGWTTGIHLSHHAPSRQIEIIADQIIQALSD